MFSFFFFHVFVEKIRLVYTTPKSNGNPTFILFTGNTTFLLFFFIFLKGFLKCVRALFLIA